MLLVIWLNEGTEIRGGSAKPILLSALNICSNRPLDIQSNGLILDEFSNDWLTEALLNKMRVTSENVKRVGGQGKQSSTAPTQDLNRNVSAGRPSVSMSIWLKEGVRQAKNGSYGLNLIKCFWKYLIKILEFYKRRRWLWTGIMQL